MDAPVCFLILEAGDGARVESRLFGSGGNHDGARAKPNEEKEEE